MVGRITSQQWKVFGMFAVAFVLSGCATVYAMYGVNHMALPAAAVALVLTVQIINEARAG